LNSSLFLLGDLRGEILPMEKGLAAPLRRTREFGSLSLCKGAESTLLEIVFITLSSSVPSLVQFRFSGLEFFICLTWRLGGENIRLGYEL